MLLPMMHYLPKVRESLETLFSSFSFCERLLLFVLVRPKNRRYITSPKYKKQSAAFRVLSGMYVRTTQAGGGGVTGERGSSVKGGERGRAV